MIEHARESIALVELVFYASTLFLTSYVCYKHGSSRSSGWLYTLLLCIIRTVGGIMHFLMYSSQSARVLQAILILDPVGLSLLLLATLGLLSRFVNFVNTASAPRITTQHFRLVQVALLVGMILAIAGGFDVSIDVHGTYSTSATSRVGVILYIVGFAAIALFFLLSVAKISVVPNNERRIPMALALALPLILVRLLYSILSIFIHNDLFSVAAGSATIRLGMSVIEEFVVVAVYAILGLLVDKLDVPSKVFIVT